jgi:hypothetical protein
VLEAAGLVTRSQSSGDGRRRPIRDDIRGRVETLMASPLDPVG